MLQEKGAGKGVRVTLGKRTYRLFIGEEGLDKSPCHKETKLPVAFFSHFLYQKTGDIESYGGKGGRTSKIVPFLYLEPLSVKGF